MTITADRFDVRCEKDEKRLIVLAAQHRGTPLSAYVRSVVLRDAQQVIIEAAAANAVMLSVAESQRFLEALSAPFQPNAKLAQAMERAKAAP